MDVVQTLWLKLPFFSSYQSFGLKLLGIALMVNLFRQALRFSQGRSVDVISPLVHTMIIAAIISNMRLLGVDLIDGARRMSEGLTEGMTRSLFESVYDHVAKSAGEFSLMKLVDAVYSLRVIAVITSICLMFWMQFAEFIVLDILWPIFFLKVLLLGMFAMPVGMLFGNPYTAWVKNFIEVILWPIIFSLMGALLVAAFDAYMGAMGKFSVENFVKLAFNPLAKGEELATALNMLMKFNAACFVYIFMLFVSPILAMYVTRGTSVGQGATQALSGMVALASMGASALASAAGAGLLAGGGQMASSGMSAGGGGGGGYASLAGDSSPEVAKLDQRDSGSSGALPSGMPNAWSSPSLGKSGPETPAVEQADMAWTSPTLNKAGPA